MTRLAGLYVIIDPDACRERSAVDVARLALEGGACAVQLRDKLRDKGEQLPSAREIARLCREHGALFIVNDHADLALAAGADGVHLGQDDLPLAQARELVRRVNPQAPFLIGVSTHDREQVMAAVRDGADYLGFGPIYSTSTKVNPDPVQGLEGLRQAVAASQGVPIVAIGGITPDKAGDLAAAGAAGACCISAVNHAENPASAGARVSAAFAARAVDSAGL